MSSVRLNYLTSGEIILRVVVKQKATIEQLEHISIMVEQKARNERFSAAHCGCEADGDDTAARVYQRHCIAEGNE